MLSLWAPIRGAMTLRRLVSGLLAAVLLALGMSVAGGAVFAAERSDRIGFIWLPVLKPGLHQPPLPPSAPPVPLPAGAAEDARTSPEPGLAPGLAGVAPALPGVSVVPAEVVPVADAVTDRVAPAAPAAGPPLTSDTPEAGESVGVVPGKRPVTVRLPGRGGTVSIDRGVIIPVGAVVDARNAEVSIVSARDDRGTMQTGVFWGGRFEVRQNPGPAPVTELVLRGGNAAVCPTPAQIREARERRLRPVAGRLVRRLRPTARAARKVRKVVVRRLWGRDRSGRFRTRGSHAVATVRGTRWLTEDRCDGTRVTVSEGAVSVWPTAGGKATLVRAGESLLAPAR